VSVRWFHHDRAYHVVGFELRAAPTDSLIAELAKLPELREATFRPSLGPVRIVRF
jgi:hypothetical protein